MKYILSRAETLERELKETQESVREAEQALRESRSEVESLRKELTLVRVAETNALSAAMRERRAAQESAAELQGAVNRAEKDLDTFRERAEAQLASLSLERDRENICYQARVRLAGRLLACS